MASEKVEALISDYGRACRHMNGAVEARAALVAAIDAEVEAARKEAIRCNAHCPIGNNAPCVLPVDHQGAHDNGNGSVWTP